MDPTVHAVFPATRMPNARRPDVVAGQGLPPGAAPGTPAKRIRTSDDIAAFASSDAHAAIKRYIGAWASAAQLVPRCAIHATAGEPEQPLPSSDASGAPIAPAVRIVYDLLRTLREWVAEIPLVDTHKARFGNPAYRDFNQRLNEQCEALFLEPLVAVRPEKKRSEVPDSNCVAELKGYLLDSFGNATRIDYGTGHELHFALFLFVLERQGALDAETCGADLDAAALNRQVYFMCFWGYIDFMRLMQGHYRMEPAGSHGVWGLDDFHHIPFVVGAAQLSEPNEAEAEAELRERFKPSRVSTSDIPPPSTSVDQVTIDRMRNDWFYHCMIGWIKANKRGPFHEHSSVLYNVSGLEDWRRISNGMVKMWDGEVLQKINIVQHLLFGHHFAFPAGHSHHAAPRPGAMPPGMVRHPGAAGAAPKPTVP